MSDAPRVSVIVPALNEEKLLPAMLAQFTDDLLRRHRIELIVSDGGSTDATLAIARSRAHIVVENTARTKQTIAMGRTSARLRRTATFWSFSTPTRWCMRSTVSSMWPRAKRSSREPRA